MSDFYKMIQEFNLCLHILYSLTYMQDKVVCLQVLGTVT